MQTQKNIKLEQPDIWRGMILRSLELVEALPNDGSYHGLSREETISRVITSQHTRTTLEHRRWQEKAYPYSDQLGIGLALIGVINFANAIFWINGDTWYMMAYIILGTLLMGGGLLCVLLGPNLTIEDNAALLRSSTYQLVFCLVDYAEGRHVHLTSTNIANNVAHCDPTFTQHVVTRFYKAIDALRT